MVGQFFEVEPPSRLEERGENVAATTRLHIHVRYSVMHVCALFCILHACILTEKHTYVHTHIPRLRPLETAATVQRAC